MFYIKTIVLYIRANKFKTLSLICPLRFFSTSHPQQFVTSGCFPVMKDMLSGRVMSNITKELRLKDVFHISTNRRQKCFLSKGSYSEKELSLNVSNSAHF